MKTRVAILVMAAAAVIAVGIVVAPRPALSQGAPQPVSIAWSNSTDVLVLYDNAEVWMIHWTPPSPMDVSYPGAAAVKATSWGKLKSDFADD